jgi:hypothetical protein
VSVAYVQSLAKLTHQVAIVDAKVNMDDLVKWHDQSFFLSGVVKQLPNQRNVVNVNAPKVLMIIE